LLIQLQSLKNVELCFSPDDAAREIQPWLSAARTSAPQGEGDLGERLCRAFGRAFRSQARRVVIIGSDCPEVTEADIRAAWDGLRAHDVVLGPARDGGYWLIGLRSLQPALFRGIPWSTADVLAATQERARVAGLRVQLLRELSDIDTVEDWRRFAGRPTGEPAVKRKE
jgi:rSAM/selenodomain-associated transferase 1